MGWNIERFFAKETIVDEFICSICTDVVENPVQTPCQHLFCNDCIRRWIKEGRKTCPEDRQRLTASSLKPPSRLTQQFLNKLMVKCRNYSEGCHLLTTYADMAQLVEHELSQCQVVQGAIVREVCDQFEKETNSFKQKMADLRSELVDKEKIISSLKKTISENEKIIANQSAIGKLIADHAVNNAKIAKTITEEAAKLAGTCYFQTVVESSPTVPLEGSQLDTQERQVKCNTNAASRGPQEGNILP
jgi:E3 ubiquitin-protein ligase NRDP1